MKFASVVKGTRAERPVVVPGFEDGEGKPFTVLMRPLTGIQYESACADARRRAIEKGVENPSVGDPIYDLALQAFILAQGCVDPDSPENARSSSFSNGVEILTEMHPETIVYLHEHHETWQDECSPYVKRIGIDALSKRLEEVAGPEGLTTFMRFSPSMRLNFALSTARTLWTLLKLNSSSGDISESISKMPASELTQTPEPTQ